ncbi:hypothetical protein BU16DRAFT_49773 [Lophium mytilinum]|uniref:Uncharacterized protein n=1 Tax=Lophium mytilinum TaxID=390894 RepID=A0A6A6QVB7_9PEZI|nr:hypothetical protein BU16DRAFT_49773 [Lophium mytilinum]
MAATDGEVYAYAVLGSSYSLKQSFHRLLRSVSQFNLQSLSSSMYRYTFVLPLSTFHGCVTILAPLTSTRVTILQFKALYSVYSTSIFVLYTYSI